MKDKFDLNKFLQNKKTVPIIVAIGIIGILIILISDMLPQKNNTVEENMQNISTDSQYLEDLKNDIKTIVLSITGEESVEVVVSLETGIEYVYATEKDTDLGVKENKQSEGNYNNETSDKTEESYIIINNGTGEQPLIISTINPKIRGISIVCSSGFSQEICDTIKTSISTLCNISEKKISVSGKY